MCKNEFYNDKSMEYSSEVFPVKKKNLINKQQLKKKIIKNFFIFRSIKKKK